MKRYNIINNSLGWLCFVIAAVTYLLTLEPTASFWDCPEFITQGYKLEVGHPPGNPIFMLTARFFVTLFGGTAQNAAIAVNSMSALLSAGTILLLFWTVTHLTRRLIVKDGSEVSPRQMLLIMGAGLCAALGYTWSDTFWFSAVEGEVYAFSSFCTALVFWLILKWENRADQPHSDRYLILIAYVIGISIAVHLLNLLCVPAIVLVFYYRKTKNATLKGSLLALLLSFVLVALILYGLVPGFISVAQRFELFFVNVLGMGYNSGVIVYALLTVAVFVWTLYSLYRQTSRTNILIGTFLSVILSGMPFIGHSWLIPFVLIVALGVYLFGLCKKIPVRIFSVSVWSIFVIFIGYSSYALLLIRSSADTPMNQNAPDNVFALASYLNREQYGDRPLIYGQTVAEELAQPQYAGQDENGAPLFVYQVDDKGYPVTSPINGVVYDGGMPVSHDQQLYTKVVKTKAGEPDRYVKEVSHPEYEYSSDVMMLFPRIYSSLPQHVKNYKSWAVYENPDFEQIPVALLERWRQAGYAPANEVEPYLNNTQDFDMGTYTDSEGNVVPYRPSGWKMGFGPSLRYFFNYQLNHMYWRYFMWNFAGRQNDLQGNGEPHLGNWISGIPAIDNARLGDQSELPDEFGAGNKGHNVFYMLPLLLGLIGLLWQSMARHRGGENRGIEQFWVIFFLFFMTGVAIVLYLNQTPGQPRERDYAFAGSFYAYAIWMGLGIPALAHCLRWLLRAVSNGLVKRDKQGNVVKEGKPLSNGQSWACAAVAFAVALLVPLQMVSQTWDDHDRSGRYTARDFGMNNLNSLDDNAIIFTNGDNDTFPLWYAQEVEGVRPDVKVVNLEYLATDWYANQLKRPSYTAKPVPMYATPQDYEYESFWMRVKPDPALEDTIVTAEVALKDMYSRGREARDTRKATKFAEAGADVDFVLRYPNVYVPLDSVATLKTFGRLPDSYDPQIGYFMNLDPAGIGSSAGLKRTLAYDIIANSAAGGWKRPVYFASTVSNDNYMSFTPYLYNTGIAKMVTPFQDKGGSPSPLADKAYRNIMERYRWGGLDSGKDIYIDETVHRMISSMRLAIIDVVNDLLIEADRPASKWAQDFARSKKEPVPATKADMARRLIKEMDTRMPAATVPYETYIDLERATTLCRLYSLTGNAADLKAAQQANNEVISRYGKMLRYASSLDAGTRASLGGEMRQSFAFPELAVGFLNYLDLRQAMVKAGAPEEHLLILDDTCNTGIGQYVYNWVYLSDYTEDELKKLADSDSQFADYAAYALQLRELHRVYLPGKSLKTRTNEAARRMGISVDEWRRIAR